MANATKKGGGPRPVPSPSTEEKPKKKSWSGTWVEGVNIKRDPDGGATAVAKIMTNIDDEIDKLYKLTRKFASVSVKTSGGMAVSAKLVGYSLKTTSTPGKLVATVTVEGPRKFSDMVSRQVTVDGSQKVLPLHEPDGEQR